MGSASSVLLHYISAPSVIGVGESGFPKHPFRILGVRGPSSFSRGEDLAGSSVSNGDICFAMASFPHGTKASSLFHMRSVPLTRSFALRRQLSAVYGDTATAILSTISAEILASVGKGDDNSNLCSFVADEGDLSFRVSLPAVFPIPYNTSFTLSAPLALPVDLSSDATRDQFKLQAAALGA
jgi:hypothetical protein